MRVFVEWNKPVPMKKAPPLIYRLDLDRVPRDPGVYVFGRTMRGGAGIEALYVGQAMNMWRRVRGQLNNLKLMAHIRDARYGQRVLLTGSIAVRGGQQVGKCLDLAERAFIRYFLSEGHDLVNQMGTRLRQHEVVSSFVPAHFVPGEVFLERAGRPGTGRGRSR